MSVWSTYRQLLGNRPLAKLLVGEFVSSVGDWLYLVALVVLVYRETGDPIILGIVGAARLVPYIVLSLPAGVLTDRFDRRSVLLASDLGRAACMVVLAGLVVLDAGIIPIAIVSFVATSFSTFFYPAFGAYLPSLVRDEAEFGPANSAWATLDNLAWIIGPGIAGLILLTGNLEVAFLLNAASFGVIGVALWTLPRSKASPLSASTLGSTSDADEPSVVKRPGWFGRIPAAINLPAVSGVILLDALAWLAFGGINILIVLLAIDVFQAGDEATGYLNMAIGIGGTLGAVVSGVLVLRPRLGPALLCAGAAFSVAVVLLGIAPELSVAFVAVAIASVGHLVLDVTRTTIFQRVVPDAYRGRFTGVLMTSSTASEAVGTLILPIMIGVLGLTVALGFVGAALFGATLVAIALIGRAADVAPGPFDAELRRIAGLPVFGGLSPARVEAGLRALEPVSVAAGTIVIRQGEPADRFFVIGDGIFEVTQADEAGANSVLRRLERDAVFGERGLLARAPRSATVHAVTDGLLFAMHGPTFLEMVGAHRGVAERFMALYDQPASEAAARP